MKLLIVPCLLALFTFSSFAQRIVTGEVVEVIDGSTFSFSALNSTFKVRLQYVDPPEAGQELHDVVKSHLEKLIKNKTVNVQFRKSSGDIWIGKVQIGDIDVAMQMLRDGAVWYLVPEGGGQMEPDRAAYLELERQARAEKRGIWGIANIKPAFELRQARKKAEEERLAAEREEAAQRAGVFAISLQPVLG